MGPFLRLGSGWWGGGERLLVAFAGRAARWGLLPNWAGGHMSVRPLPYLEGRCKTGPTCHRRAMTGLLWAQLFSATFKQRNLPLFFFFSSRLKNDTSTRAESPRGAHAPPAPPPSLSLSLAGFATYFVSLQSPLPTCP